MSSKKSYSVVIKGGEITPVIKLPSSDSTILNLKEHIEGKLGIQIARQTLWTPENVKMEDAKTIADYGPISAVRLHIQPAQSQDVTFTVVVFTDSNADVVHEFGVKESDTVMELKRKMEGAFKVKAIDMTLWCGTNEMKDELALSKYYIGAHRSRLALKITNKPGETIH